MFRNNWRQFGANFLGISELWDRQSAIIDSVASRRLTAVRAGHGVGKTFAGAVAALWFLYCRAPAKVLITAPTEWQAQQVFWGAMKNLRARARRALGGVMGETKLALGEEWWAQVRATKSVDFFQGVHGKNLLVIVDEAAGVDEAIFEGVKTLLTGEGNKVLLMGNPVRRSGSFHAAFSDAAYGHVHLSCLKHPNVVEGREIIPGAVTREWIEERRAEWEGTPLWQARVLGEFPDAAEDQLISLELLGMAESREVVPTGPAVIGVDVARYGNDETAIYVMRDGAVVDSRFLRKRDLMETAGHVHALAQTHDVKLIAVDDTGLGGGLTDRLRELGHEVAAINFGSAPDNAQKYYDLPSELWGELSEGFRAGALGPIPANDVLSGQLTARRYTYRDCRLKVEGREEMRRRGLKSPDRADALALAWRAMTQLRRAETKRSNVSFGCAGNVWPE